MEDEEDEDFFLDEEEEDEIEELEDDEGEGEDEGAPVALALSLFCALVWRASSLEVRYLSSSAQGRRTGGPFGLPFGKPSTCREPWKRSAHHNQGHAATNTGIHSK